MNTIRRFEINIKCASCQGVLAKLFADFPDISWNLNVSAKILKITCDENKYSDDFIIKKLASVGYSCARID
ncbi:hypothetical protein [Mycoplasma sp. 'Moose RK']|uniref:hypothetical protein n=1 Tax=Mycoplasma sp. 'Moose RK' TaxID=2780095 RepID=UPI0018C2A4EB|nr:hypothetical protein [Mycoplasma sp. 'Moose RK']MBG0731070.1 hypothetical protein [Mycoplasma sp. 'Moose RK']